MFPRRSRRLILLNQHLKTATAPGVRIPAILLTADPRHFAVANGSMYGTAGLNERVCRCPRAVRKNRIAGKACTLLLVMFALVAAAQSSADLPAAIVSKVVV